MTYDLLTDAYLTDAYLTDAYLTDANLTDAYLTDAYRLLSATDIVTFAGKNAHSLFFLIGHLRRK